MNTVFKSDLPVTDDLTTISMPVDSEVIHVGNQNPDSPGMLQLWYQCSDDAPLVKRHFVTIGTGHRVPFKGKYVGTCLVAEGRLVWHVFEVQP